MKKKILLTILSMGMVLSLAACAEQKVVSVSDDVAEISVETETSEEAGESEEAEETEEVKEFEVGQLSENTYENSYIGVGCKLDESWALLSEEQIKQYNQITSETLGEDYAEQVAALDSAFDMMAINVDNQVDNINVILQKLSGLQLLINENTFVEAAIADPSTKQGLEATGYENVVLEKGTINFLGEEHICIRTSADFQDTVKLYQALIPVKTSGHIACITITTYMEDNTQAVADLFYAVEK